MGNAQNCVKILQNPSPNYVFGVVKCRKFRHGDSFDLRTPKIYVFSVRNSEKLPLFEIALELRKIVLELRKIVLELHSVFPHSCVRNPYELQKVTELIRTQSFF